jgi:hypothetical protein
LVGRTRQDRREHHEANDGGLGETALPKSADCVTSVKNWIFRGSHPRIFPLFGMPAMLFKLTTQEKRIVALIAVLIVLGLIGFWVL